MKTSDLLRVFAAMTTGKIVLHDDLQFGDPAQVAFVKYVQYVMERQSFSFLDVALDVHNPEQWSLPVSATMLY
jgi:hypothetical protein